MADIKILDVVGDGAIEDIDTVIARLGTIDDLMIQIINRSKSLTFVGAGGDLQSAVTAQKEAQKLAKDATDALDKQSKTVEQVRLAEIRLAQQREKAFDDYEKKLKRQQDATDKAAQREQAAIEKVAKAREDKARRDQAADDKYIQSLRKQEEADKRAADTRAKLAAKEASQYEQLKVAYHNAAEAAKEIGVAQGVNSQAFIKAAADAQSMYKVLFSVESAVGQSQRGVGQYERGSAGLSNAVQQILREAPSAVNSINTFFLAISNNLPILFDEIGRVNKQLAETNAAIQEQVIIARANAEAQALQAGATKEVAIAQAALAEEAVLANAAQQKMPSVLAQIGKSLLSVGTLLNVGVLLLTLYGGQIITWVGQLFKAKDALDAVKVSNEQFQKALESSEYKTAIENVASLTDNLNLAKKGFIEKTDVVEQYNKSIGDAAGKVSDLDGVEQGLIAHKDAYVQMMFYKAVATKALKDAVDETVASQKALNETGDPTLLDQLKGRGFAGAYAAEVRRKKEADEHKKQADILLKISENANKKGAELAKKNGLDYGLGGNAAPGSVADLRQQIQLLKEKIDTEKVGSVQQLADTQKLIALEKQLRDIEGRTPKGRAPHDQTNERVASEKFNIEQIAKLREEQYKTDAQDQRKIFEDVSQSLEKRLQAYREYENDLKLIAQAQAKGEIDAVKSSLSEIEKIKLIDAKKRTPAQKALLDKEIGFNAELERLTAGVQTTLKDIEADGALKRVQILKQEEAERLRILKNISDVEIKSGPNGVGATQTRKQYVEEQIKLYEQFGQIAHQTVGEISNLTANLNAQNIAQIDKEISKVKEQSDAQIEAYKSSAAYATASELERTEQIESIRAAANEKEKELEREKVERQRRQAIFQKAITVAGIIAQTAYAIVQALADLSTGNTYLKIANAIAVGVLGTAQTAAALAAPIPQYAIGTEDSGKAGLAIVGEKRREVIETKDGIFLTPDTATLTYLPAHSKVHKSVEDYIDSAHASTYAGMGIMKRLDERDTISTKEMEKLLRANVAATQALLHKPALTIQSGFFDANYRDKVKA